MKKYNKLFIKVTVSTVLLFIIFRTLDTDNILETFSNFDYSYLPLILLSLILNYVVSSYRWKALLVHENSKNVKVPYLIGLYFKGAFFNNFMPTSIGGDVYKVLTLGKKINSKVDAFTSTFMERFTGVLALGLISSISLVKLLGSLGVILLGAFIFSIFVGFYLLRLLSKKFSFLSKIYKSLITYKGRNKVIWWAMGTSFAVQFLAILTQYLIFMALGINLPIFYALVTFPIITLAGFFIPSLNGVGVQDALYMSLFGQVGVASAVSFSASVIYHLFRLSVSLIGGVWYAIGKD